MEFLHRIRAEVKFASIDELKAQLQQDIKIARIYFDYKNDKRYANITQMC